MLQKEEEEEEEGSVVTDRLAQIVSGHAHVAAVVRLAPSSVDDTQEEEGAAGQQHAVGAGVVAVRLDALPVFGPLHRRGRTALGLTVESGRLPFGDDEARGRLLKRFPSPGLDTALGLPVPQEAGECPTSSLIHGEEVLISGGTQLITVTTTKTTGRLVSCGGRHSGAGFPIKPSSPKVRGSVTSAAKSTMKPVKPGDPAGGEFPNSAAAQGMPVSSGLLLEELMYT
ncbi:hypothetical protein EYF80_002944 [Liparis tanakae]|uniref:Uncharacterized protein n=1 Tax=Liparis tanakae TaxID=230148 RepID=A0A4Z2JA08_9TELE|nr:hypothetical protein EYF80_002944 [Liparis tanakae]